MTRNRQHGMLRTMSMKSVVVIASLLLLVSASTVLAAERLPHQPEGVDVWWALSSAAKVRPDRKAPDNSGQALRIRLARNETDAAQVILRPRRRLQGFRIGRGALLRADGARPAH